MGTKMGPSYANLFAGYIEHQFFNQYNGPKPDLYRRYIDDCVDATSSTRQELNCNQSHVKNSIPYSQFLRLRRLCSEDSDFSLKSEEVREFFDKRGYPASDVEAGHHRAQQIDRQSALQTSQKENNVRIPFTLTFHPHNHAVKSIIPKNFKLL